MIRFVKIPHVRSKGGRIHERSKRLHPNDMQFRERVTLQWTESGSGSPLTTHKRSKISEIIFSKDSSLDTDIKSLSSRNTTLAYNVTTSLPQYYPNVTCNITNTVFKSLSVIIPLQCNVSTSSGDGFRTDMLLYRQMVGFLDRGLASSACLIGGNQPRLPDYCSQFTFHQQFKMDDKYKTFLC